MRRDPVMTRSVVTRERSRAENERKPLPLNIRHAWAATAGIAWRSRPDLDQLSDAEFVAVIREAWSPERREAARAAAQAAWRERYPDRAAIRDAILARATPEPCDRCGTEDEVRLFVTDYATGAHVWRCQTCAIAARAEWPGDRP